MSTTLREALAARIDQIGPAHPNLDELVGLGERRLRRRRIAVVVASGAAVILVIALAIGGAAMINSAEHDNGPVDHPIHPTTTTVRPLVYSDDVDYIEPRSDAGGVGIHIGMVHVGDQLVNIDQTLPNTRRWNLEVTDAGVVYDKDDGNVWFSDGGTPRRIAGKHCGGQDAIGSGDSGPWAFWFDCESTATRGDLVVFDTGSGEEIARQPIPYCHNSRFHLSYGFACWPTDIIGDHVYYYQVEDHAGTPCGCRERLYQFDVSAGTVVVATDQRYAADLRSHPRALVVGDSWRTGARETGMDFVVVGSRLVPAAFDSASNETVPTRARIFATPTGQPVRFHLAPDYKPGESDEPVFYSIAWIDDDTLAVGAPMADPLKEGWTADILACHISNGRCEQIVKPPSHDTIRIVPGLPLPG